MKLEYLIIIFLLIIIPIYIVTSLYIDNNLSSLKTELSYNRILRSSSYDAIKAFQLNTIHNAYSDNNTTKINNLIASVNTFFLSLSANFGIEGNENSAIQEYVPAVVFTMYDGYYLYSPFYNTLTEVETQTINDEGEIVNLIDNKYGDNDLIHGLKPYVYYSCRYQRTKDGHPSTENEDFTITYTLDNYITIDGLLYTTDENGIEKLNYVHDSGYLLPLGNYGDSSGKIYQHGTLSDTYVYDGITITKEPETLSEYLSDGNEYKYIKLKGTKYYWCKDDTDDEDPKKNYIFTLSENDTRIKQAICGNNEYTNYIKAIDYNYSGNYSGYLYYKNAYEFSKRALEDYNLQSLQIQHLYEYQNASDTNKILEKYNVTNEGEKIFDGLIQESDSNFNKHRAAVIRNVIETNLQTSIAAYKNFANPGTDSNIDYIMPKISETDWEVLENNICIATFMQGMNIGSKIYNSYAVVSNVLNKEYVDENDIYILTNNGEYTRANDNNLINGTNLIQTKNPSNNYFPGFLNVDFENKISENGTYYNSIRINQNTPYYASYTGLIGSSTLNSITYSDIYKYMKGLDRSNSNVAELKKAYYMALGRERYSSYNVNSPEVQDILNDLLN